MPLQKPRSKVRAIAPPRVCGFFAVARCRAPSPRPAVHLRVVDPADDIERRARARIGQTLRGKYQLDAVLGIGGMATVYAATHRNRKRFAIKLLHTEFSTNEDIRSRFLREGYVANTVEHPGAVSVLDEDVTDDGAAFLVMELLEGEVLDALWMRSGQRLPAALVVDIGYQLLDILEAAHRKDVVHRDVKPSNIFLTKNGEVKVLDFGIARLRDGASGSVTQTGVGIGTPAFMAPEQALGKSRLIGPHTDIWAAGATLFTLLSGRYVHEAEGPQEQVVLAATVPARSLADVAPDVPPALVEVVDRALVFAAPGRWPSAAEMRRALGQLRGEMGLASGSTKLGSLPRVTSSSERAAPLAMTEASARSVPEVADTLQTSSAPSSLAAPVSRATAPTPRRRAPTSIALAGAAVLVAGGALAGLWTRGSGNTRPGGGDAGAGASASVTRPTEGTEGATSAPPLAPSARIAAAMASAEPSAAPSGAPSGARGAHPPTPHPSQHPRPASSRSIYDP
jgi:eukaryotic-like serine/threonine-protein kinase